MASSDGFDPRAEPLGPSGGPPAIECQDVSSGYLGVPVLQGVSFRIREPAIYVVLGPNGAGKTTLFRTIAGILPTIRGSVRIGDEPIEGAGAKGRLHFLSHVDGIPDGLRVEEALRFYARVQRATEADIDRVLDLLGIRDLRDRYFSGLSAGQKKRVSIARIFLKERRIYLLDEPTSNLDPRVASEIRDLILALSRDRVVLYASHNLYEAHDIGRYVLALKGGRLALFDRISALRSEHYRVGVRPVQEAGALRGVPRKGEYYLYELPGPEAVPGLIRKLEAEGVQLREVRELGNPLEDLFTDGDTPAPKPSVGPKR